MKNILILGASGMLGSMVFDYLSKTNILNSLHKYRPIIYIPDENSISFVLTFFRYSGMFI